MARKQNVVSDKVDVTTDASGDGSLQVTLENPFESTDYTVILTTQEADATGITYVVVNSASQFTIYVSGSAVVSDTLTVGYIANQNSW